jgi:hypothetical protein
MMIGELVSNIKVVIANYNVFSSIIARIGLRLSGRVLEMMSRLGDIPCLVTSPPHLVFE